MPHFPYENLARLTITQQANFAGYGSGAYLRGSFIPEFTGIFSQKSPSLLLRAGQNFLAPINNPAGGAGSLSSGDMFRSRSGGEGGEGEAALGAQLPVRTEATHPQPTTYSNRRKRSHGEPESLTSNRRPENDLAGGDDGGEAGGGDANGRAACTAKRHPDGHGAVGYRAGQMEKATA